MEAFEMKYKVALVEYLNTFPFSEGIRMSSSSGLFDVFRVPPAACASLFREGKVDISLCPVGALYEMPDYEIRSRYCIGADGTVGTVTLLSHVPLSDIHFVQLDDHSRTSNLLVQILAQRLWKKSWTFYAGSDDTEDHARLMIGDKVFAGKAMYRYQYDLAQAWKELTGLPMVFAVWINRPGMPDNIIAELDHAFETGWQKLMDPALSIAEWQKTYLLQNISYPLDADKLLALDLFLQWAEEYSGDPVTR